MEHLIAVLRVVEMKAPIVNGVNAHLRVLFEELFEVSTGLWEEQPVEFLK
jgi:hypothetical protein